MIRTSPYTARPLSYVTPLPPGGRIGVVGHHPELTSSLLRAGTEPVSFVTHRTASRLTGAAGAVAVCDPAEPLAAEDASLDMLIVPRLVKERHWLLRGEIGRVCAATSTVILGVARGRRAAAPADRLHTRTVRRALQRNMFAPAPPLGAPYGLASFRILVPLRPEPLRWVARSLYVHRSRGDRLLQLLAAAAPVAVAAPALCPAIVIVGHRHQSKA